jgi:quercetin dioxygenase-like cupin family protein
MTVATPPAEIDFLGARARVLVTGSETEGAYALVDMLEVPAGDMPPLHVHRDSDEGFYVRSGEVTLFMPGAEVTLRAGDFFLAPRGVPHTYRVGEEAAHMLVLSAPAGFEAFVAGVGQLAEVEPAALGALADEHGIDILGPPGTMP